MYCPNCGQQQISDEMRFCSRCGLALSGLAEWLAGIRMPAKRVDDEQVAAPSPRRKGMRRAAKVMFFSGVLFAIFLVISLVVEHGGPHGGTVHCLFCGAGNDALRASLQRQDCTRN
jgi:uncharacterized membrane protein YvbJ